MDKRGRLSIKVIISTILIVIILAIIFLSGVFGSIIDFAKGFSDFDKGDIVVKWDEKNFIEYPEEILFFLADCNPEISFKYDSKVYSDGEKPRGWVWESEEVKKSDERWLSRFNRWLQGYKDEKKTFISVSNEEHKYFKYLDEKNNKFIRDLNGKTPEKGLKVIVTRILENDEDNWFYNAKLNVIIGDVNLVYNPTVAEERAILADLDWLIDRLNQVSRKYLKRKERGEIE